MAPRLLALAGLLATACLTALTSVNALVYNETLDPWNINKNKGEFAMTLFFSFSFFSPLPLGFCLGEAWPKPTSPDPLNVDPSHIMFA